MLDEAERFVLRFLVALAGNTAIDVVLDVCTDVRPCVVPVKEVGCSVLSRVSSSGVIMLELEDAGSEVARGRGGVGYVYTVFD